MEIKKGNVIYLKNVVDKPNGNHIQIYNRPYLVVSNDIGNTFSNIIMVVPLSSKLKKINQPTHTLVNYHRNMVLCEQIFTVSQDDVGSVVGFISAEEQRKVDNCLMAALGVNVYGIV